jgi:hypothetical protein
MGQTPEDPYDPRHEVGSCTDVCANSYFGSNLDSPMQLVGHNSPPLLLPLEIYEEEYNNNNYKAIDDKLTMPLAQQLRRKSARRRYSRLEQQTASNRDSDADDSSSSGSEDAELGDEDYWPSPGAVGPPRKRRRMGRPQRSPKPYRCSSRLTSLPNMTNPSGLYTPAQSPCSVSSQDSATAANVEAPASKYEEWPLRGVTLKRLTMDGKVTFQLKFGWDLCTGGHSPGSQSGSRSKPHREENSG